VLKRKFGWTGIEVPVIGQGTWMMEGGRDTERLAIGALRLGLDLGLTHIDTAEMYGNGRV
jgi:aryl-alcohol dehydrogenase-like predicted oxidoreductase